jgi:gliding motility-associated-like protein
MFFPGLAERNGKKENYWTKQKALPKLTYYMRRLHRDLFLVVLMAISCSASFSQYTINGSCTQNSCHCFTLTQPITTQAGSFWTASQIDLNNPFDFRFNVYLGCMDANGADGIVFVLRPIGTNTTGVTGGSLGYQGITPSLGVEIDTWQNIGAGYNDPVFDHIAIMKNGNNDHTSPNALSSYAQASPTNANIEDCQWHDFRVSWDPAAQLMSVYFDNSLRVQYTGDIVSGIFSGNPMVYWGFVGSTGGSTNLQQVCTQLQAGITANIANNTGCVGNAVQFTDSSQCFSSIQNSYWNFGDGSTSSFLNPAPHYYYTAGTYVIRHTIAGVDGCVSDTAYKTITIGANPVADFFVNDTCWSFPLQPIDQSTCSFGTITQWTWLLDGNFLSNAQNPSLPVLPVGQHSLELTVTTQYGCAATPVTKYFTIKPNPTVEFLENAGCINQPVQFNGIHTDNQTSIGQWSWGFDDGSFSQVQNPAHVYNTAGNYLVNLVVIATNNCRGVAQHMVTIGTKPVALFQVGDDCEGNSPVISNSSTISPGSISQWNWILDGQPVSNLQIPALSGLTAGPHQLQLIATSNNGCTSDTTTHNFTIKNSPVISASGVDGCYRQPVAFNASQTDNNTSIQQWNWSFGDGGTSASQNPTHNFNAGGNYNISVTAAATNGCVSAPVQFTVKINQLTVNAGNDTVVLMNAPFTLNASASSATNSQLTYLWISSTGLNNPNILNPVASLSDNIVYTLTVTSVEGCVATDQVAIEVFKGSGIYVPSGFTPNHDGKNDLLRPKYIGIKTLNYFSVYNRWGQLVFTTSDMTKGWDATINGKEQNSGVFVWIISAVDLDGKKHELKGTTAIIH